MISIRFYCNKCNFFRQKNLEIPYLSSVTNYIDTDVYMICNECKENEKIEIRNSKIESIITKKWWKF